METISRTVRFKRSEADQIEKFLAENPFFDFSTLTRVAVLQFIQEPKLHLKAIQGQRSNSAKSFRALNLKGGK